MTNYLIEDFRNADINNFEQQVNDGLEIEISFPLSSIGFTQSNIDIVQDYAKVSFCSESIAPYIKVIDSGFVTIDKIHTYFKIKCKVTDGDSLSEKLIYYSEIFSGEFQIYDDINAISFYDEVSDHEEGFGTKEFIFTSLISNYWANLVNGAHREIASEYHESESSYLKDIYKKYPEQQYGFWENSLSANFKDPLYFSTENWIAPPHTDITKALSIYSEVDYIGKIEEAEKVLYNKSIVLINSTSAVRFNQLDQLLHSIKCAAYVLAYKYSVNPEEHFDKIIVQLELFPDYEPKKKQEVTKVRTVRINEENIKYYLSELGDVVVASYKDFKYAFFINDILNFEQIKELNSFLYPAFAKTQKIIEDSVLESCNWALLNDDSFEELCYDILYCHPKFDSSSIQKMGKSRSRDGGRDIVIKTRSTPGREQELYVFQCKYLSPKTSLSVSKLPNAANVIMQYGAKGYGIFTTTVIDATLYDMLDGFHRNQNIDTAMCWSKYELERYLNRYQILKGKYFKQ